MKKLYVIILFLIFFNVTMFMVGSLGVFNYTYEGDSSNYNISDNGTGRAEDIFYDISDGVTINHMFSIFFGDLSSATGLITTIVIMGAAAAAAWLTKSPAPFVLGFIINVMKNLYVNSYAVIKNLPLNNYLLLAGLLGMVFLFVITCAETLTHGEV